MKKLVSVIEVEGEGLTALLGEQVLLFCMNYFYTGKLVGVNQTCVQLENASIVYETGKLDSKKFQVQEALPCKTWYVATSAIESYGALR